METLGSFVGQYLGKYGVMWHSDPDPQAQNRPKVF